MLMYIAMAGNLKHQIHGSGTEGDSLYSAFRKLRLEMLTNYAKPWDTTELCKTVSLEKSQFYSCYQKFFQSTLMQICFRSVWIRQKNLLTNEALTVQQIAQMCGFSDFSHFSRYFRKQAGCSPLQWRRKWESPIDTLTIFPDSVKCIGQKETGTSQRSIANVTVHLIGHDGRFGFVS